MPTAPAWEIAVAVAGGTEALRARYPLVNALLVEMAAQQQAGRVSVRTRQRV